MYVKVMSNHLIRNLLISDDDGEIKSHTHEVLACTGNAATTIPRSLLSGDCFTSSTPEKNVRVKPKTRSVTVCV